MRYFIKHVLRTIKAFPARPLLILVTVILSVATATTAFRTEALLRKHSKERIAADTALGDLLISVRGDSEVRMLFAKDAEAIVGGRGEVLGEYGLTVYFPEGIETHLLSASATDLEAADAYFRFSFTEYGRFTTENLDRSAVLSSTFAEENSLSVGDRITLTVLGREVEYTVQAIAEPTGLLSERELLLPISGLLQLLGEEVPAIAALDVSLIPCNRLMLKVPDELCDGIMSELSASAVFGDQQVSETADEGRLSYMLFWQINITRLLALLVLLLCGILIGTCLHQLRRSRAAEIALFCSVGASRRHLWCLQLTENAVYAVLGSLGGVLLAIPTVRAVGRFFPWNHTVTRLSALDMLFGVGFACLLLLGFSLPPLFETRREVRLHEEQEEVTVKSHLSRMVLPVCALLVLCTALCCLLPTSLGFVSGVAAFLCTVWLFFKLAPFLLRHLACPIEALQDRSRRPFPPLFLAAKSLRHHPSAPHTARLLSLLFMLLLTLTVCKNTTADQLHMIEHAVSGEMIAVNLNPELEEELREHPAVSGLMRFTFATDAGITDRHSAVVLAATGDTEQCLLPELIPSDPPRSGEIIISVGISRLTGKQVGDSMELTVGGVPQTMTVAAINATQAPLILLSADSVDGNDPVCIALHKDATEEDRAALRNLLETNGVLLTEKTKLLKSLPDTAGGFLTLLGYIMPAATLISLVGIANLLAEQYRTRRRERALLTLCGATKAGIAATYAVELVILLLFSFLFALLGSAFLLFLIDRILTAVGMALFV